MPIEVNPNARSTIEVGQATFTVSPLTLDEEHQILDMQSRGGIWGSRLFMLRRKLVAAENWKLPFESHETLGGASDSFIQHLPIKVRAAICDHILESVVLEEEDLEK